MKMDDIYTCCHYCGKDIMIPWFNVPMRRIDTESYICDACFEKVQSNWRVRCRAQKCNLHRFNGYDICLLHIEERVL